tara:strand:- start:42 stop:521 length:480 start_codon:yes stop_codon:yes gene_type:complete
MTDWYKDIKIRDEFVCQHCGSKEGLVSHHIFPKSQYSGLQLNLNNGITLCHECHMSHHGWGQYERVLESNAWRNSVAWNRVLNEWKIFEFQFKDVLRNYFFKTPEYEKFLKETGNDWNLEGKLSDSGIKWAIHKLFVKAYDKLELHDHWKKREKEIEND